MENKITIGMDLGDQNPVGVVLDDKGKEIEMKPIRSTAPLNEYKELRRNKYS